MANLKKRKNKKQTKNNNIKKKIKQIIKNKKKKTKKKMLTGLVGDSWYKIFPHRNKPKCSDYKVFKRKESYKKSKVCFGNKLFGTHCRRLFELLDLQSATYLIV